jgi:hypothetical protein
LVFNCDCGDFLKGEKKKEEEKKEEKKKRESESERELDGGEERG